MKERLREEKLAIRNALSDEARAAKSAAIISRLFQLEAFDTARTVMTYAAFGSEVQTVEFITIALRKGKRVAMPIIARGRRLKLGAINKTAELVPGPLGIMEPPSTALPVDPAEVDLVMVPGVVFDLRGYRLGYGGGYYDRFMRLLREDALLVGVAFELQVVEELPGIEEHDLPVDLIATEERVIRCAFQRA